MTPAPAPTPDPAAALIAAAEAHRDKLAGLCSLSESEVQLCKAVDACRQSRQPQGVRPEAVEPGTRFRFAAGEMADSTSVYVKMARYPYRTADSGYRAEGDNVFYDFKPEDRIIPIPE